MKIDCDWFQVTSYASHNLSYICVKCWCSLYRKVSSSPISWSCNLYDKIGITGHKF